MSLLNVLKHLPGKHSQSSHNPHKGGGYVTGPNGQPLVLYHGTGKSFDDFQARQKYTPQEQFGFGVHFAESPDFAQNYAVGKVGRVVKARLRANNMLDADQIVKEGSPEFALAQKIAGKKLVAMKDGDGKRVAYLQNAIDSVHPKKAETAIREAGYDAVRYQAKYGSRALRGNIISAESPSYVVFDPAQIEVIG